MTELKYPAVEDLEYKLFQRIEDELCSGRSGRIFRKEWGIMMNPKMKLIFNSLKEIENGK